MVFNALHTSSATTKKRRAKLMADIQIRPFRFETMVFKIIVMKNVQKEATPFQTVAPETIKMKDSSMVVSEFAEDFPTEVERIEICTAKSGEDLPQDRKLGKKKTIWLFQKEKAVPIPESFSSVNTIMKIPNLRKKTKRRTHPAENEQQEHDYYKQQETVKILDAVFSKGKIKTVA